MQRSISLLLLVFTAGVVKGQNIYSALQLNEETAYKGKRPKQIAETRTFFGQEGQKIEKSVKVFDAAGMLLTEERFDENGKRTARLTLKNDTVNRRCLERSFERWGSTGNAKETTIYSYDASHFLIRVTDQDANGATMLISKITNDEKGHPVALSLEDGQGTPIGRETATYFYDRNSVVTAVLDGDDHKVSTDTMKISIKDARLHPAEGSAYNEQGDATKWARGANDLYEAEYVYDASGNCIDEVIYKIEVKGAAKPKKKKEKRVERQYTY